MYHAVSTVMTMRRNGAARDGIRGDSEAHNFQEYTYKKITPCDVCSQIDKISVRNVKSQNSTSIPAGHTRQGLRCRICKMNVHTDCMPQVGKCQTKSRLLRRQKSTSEIEAHRVQDPGYEEEKEEVDQTYQVLKRANEIAKPGGAGGGPVVRVSAPEEPPAARSPARPSTGLAVAPQQISSSSGLAPRPHPVSSRFASPLGSRPPSTVARPSQRTSYQTPDGRRQLLKPLVFSSVELEETMSRPFGQPLCITNENGDPPPSILKPTASVRKKK
ncbi:unnamed protein product [Leptidea sinapis]|uniref:Phorbol-ester/DAG-type domain-containing protein n=1 Tax=Leptidea sinapis TaxID=189913 RepID=A0A5E4QJZ7_9NEOP|nr:unnamed protein product [Leptidea sinapis]